MPGRNFTDSEEAEIAKIYQAGHSAKAIARAYGLSHHISICAALGRQGIQQRAAPERNRLYRLNPHVFDAIDNETAAYWWGFIYADGCVSRRTLTTTLHRKDRDHLARLRDFMRATSPIVDIMANDGMGSKTPQSRVDFTDRDMASRLRALGILPHRPRFDLVTANLPDNLRQHWIRGFFDGDGSARKANNTRGGSLVFCGQRSLLEWIRAVFAECVGTNPNLAVTACNHSSICYYYISGNRQARNAAAYMYDGATIWLPRKREVYEAW